ncbi:hypothetical protein [Endozoicomonas atrinae]|uniref:hypothetical protein n=1 Tax=Endozoicomonas atrinae TaxID=1333660 RepID=UPI0008245725|nr:hypothetical protein [Endozoicomonas atrinae]
MESETVEVTGMKAESIDVRDDGHVNLVCVWGNRGFDESLDLQLFFADKGIERFIRYLETQSNNPPLQVNRQGEEVWVHPLVMYRYLAWCEPQVDALCMDLYHMYTRHKAKTLRSDAEHTTTWH